MKISALGRTRGVTPQGFEGLRTIIVQLRQVGKSYRQISRVVGVSEYLVKRALVEMGMRESAPRTPYKLSIPKQRVQEMVEQGKTRHQIQRILGRSNRSVLTLLARYGLTAAQPDRTNVQLAQKGKRRCCRCRRIKLLAIDFYRAAAMPEGRNYRCKDCSRQMARKAPRGAHGNLADHDEKDPFC